MIAHYGSGKVKRHACYETRKNLARPIDPPGIRFQRGQPEQRNQRSIEAQRDFRRQSIRQTFDGIEAAQSALWHVRIYPPHDAFAKSCTAGLT